MKRPPRLSLDALRAFRSAAMHLSFTRAALELFVTQSAVSHAVRTLEDQLGQALFHRVNRSLRLTHAGEALFRAADEALGLIDATAERLAGTERTLSVTTTPALASTWLAPRLPAFARLHPRTDVRLAATNDRFDLEREHLDLAIQFVPAWETAPEADLLVDYLQFPVCSPALAMDRKRPLRTFADLGRHVRLDFETVLYGRAWYDWEQWAEAMRQRAVAPAGTLRFSHYDQVIQAAIEGSGVAIGKWPHLARHLREGSLCAPLGRASVAHVGAFYLVLGRESNLPGPVAAFADWLRNEVREDLAVAPPLLAATVARRAATPARARRGATSPGRSR
jgi:DNA-binding transcriptional LysR family regulator